MHGICNGRFSCLGISLLLFASFPFAGAQTNTYTGVQAGARNTKGTNNTGVGFQALFNNKTGTHNTAMGDGSLYNNVSGRFNIAIGEDAGFRVKSGINNIHIGNKGIPSDKGRIRIGTPGVHKSTSLAGVIIGNGSGLTNIPASRIVGGIRASQIAPSAISGAALASNLALAGNTTGSFAGAFSGAFVGNGSGLSSLPVASLIGLIPSSLLAPDLVLAGTTSGKFSGNGTGLTDLNGSNIKTGTIASGRLPTRVAILDRDTQNFTGDTNTFSGNVGIGATTPAAKLDVRGDIKFGATGQYSAVGGGEKLRIIRGIVNSDGTVQKGSGFTVVRSSTGNYTVNFITPFSDTPTTTITPAMGIPPVSSLSAVAGNQVPSNTTMVVYTYIGNNINDLNFHFTAIGPQ